MLYLRAQKEALDTTKMTCHPTRLRANLEDVFVCNTVSATRARTFFEDAASAGIKGFRISKGWQEASCVDMFAET